MKAGDSARLKASGPELAKWPNGEFVIRYFGFDKAKRPRLLNKKLGFIDEGEAESAFAEFKRRSQAVAVVPQPAAPARRGRPRRTSKLPPEVAERRRVAAREYYHRRKAAREGMNGHASGRAPESTIRGLVGLLAVHLNATAQTLKLLQEALGDG